jgi:CDP-glycerol glycerophosphotransferase
VKGRSLRPEACVCAGNRRAARVPRRHDNPELQRDVRSVKRLLARGRRRRAASDMARYYREQLERPLDPDLAVYGAYWFRGYSCNPRAIYEKAHELVPDARGVWVVRKDAVDSVPPGVDYVVRGTRPYFEAIARATFLINNVNFPNNVVKRTGSVHAQTHHGTPLKYMGLDLRESESQGRGMDFDKLLQRVARWDYSISSNPHSTTVWERVYPGDYETLEIGYPRNDALASASPATVGAARAALGIADGKTAVLYAPTHREYEESYVSRLDLAQLADALGPGHVILARLHYFYDSDPLVRELHETGRLLDVASHPSVEELCLAADVLLTDYSSIMFDYAVLDRPIVIHAPDWEEYRARRGVYFDLLAEPPGTVARTQEEVAGAVAAPGDGARAAFRERFCAIEDGRSAERAVRRIWGLG